MPRLTREESQQLTRQKLIEAAEAEIIRVGIYEASIRQICDRAGFTLGAFYSNFQSKDELLMEVLNVQSQREFDALGSLVANLGSLKKKKALDGIALWLGQLWNNQILTTLTLEFEVYANRNPEFKKGYDRNKERWHRELAKALEALFTANGLRPRVPLLQVAVGLSALWDGFLMQGPVSEEVSAQGVVILFLEALLQSARPIRKPKA
jgi:AcrR family transcriptional regulator